VTSWPILIAASLCEVGWAIGLKYSQGFTRLWPSIWTSAAMVLSLVLLAWAARSLPIGTAYAVWTGIGAAGTAVLGIYLFNDPLTVPRVAGVVLIIAGVVLLRLS
jgi:quaternary ammonium compound-resistance protein SugE